MKKFRSSSTSKIFFHEGCSEGGKIKNFTPPFTEFDIIFFQKLLTTHGIHYVEVDNLYKGRKSLFTFLSSLPAYVRKACISTNFEIISEVEAYNLYNILGKIRKNDENYSLERLWSEGQHFDFLWIERSPQDTIFFTNLCQEAIRVCFKKPVCVFIMEEKIKNL